MFEFYSIQTTSKAVQLNEEVSECNSPIAEVQNDALALVRNMYKKQKVSQGSGEQKTELDKYLDDECEEDNNDFDILSWWKVNATKYKVLTLMARDVMAMPVSTVASKSTFSAGGLSSTNFKIL